MSIPPPSAFQIGERLTIALRDSDEVTHELLGTLLDECTIRKRDGTIATFDPACITHWRVVRKTTFKAGTGAPRSRRIQELNEAFSIVQQITATLPGETQTLVADTTDFPPMPPDGAMRVEHKKLNLTFPAELVSIFLDEHKVASALITIANSWGVITELFVDSENHDPKFVKALITALARISQNHGCARLTVRLHENDETAKSLWESLGFRFHN